VENNLLRKKNMSTLNYIRGEKADLSEERPEVKNLAI
jgi:hypothetical protein